MKGFNPAKLVRRRRALGMTQRTLARRACLSTVSLSAIENGKKEPRAGTLVRLAEALEVGVDYFFGF